MNSTKITLNTTKKTVLMKDIGKFLAFTQKKKQGSKLTNFLVTSPEI